MDGEKVITMGFVPNPASGLPKVVGVIDGITGINSVTEKLHKRGIVLNITKEDDDRPSELFIETVDFGEGETKNCNKLNSYKIGDTVQIIFKPESRSATKDGKTSWFGSMMLKVITLISQAVERTPSGTESKQSSSVEEVPF